MIDRVVNLPPEQEAIRAKCFHPTGTFVEFPKEEVEQSIPERFERIVRMYPNRIAVKSADHVVTYAEVNAMANRFAHKLIAQRGSEPEPIGLLLEKDVSLVTAMIGVLKAAKFFLLLGHSSPKARITGLLEDCQTQLLVTDRENVALAREIVGGDGQMIDFESMASGNSTEDPRLPILSEALAYLVYTSGSTGQPKGVIQSHRNLMHNIMLRAQAMPVSLGDRIAQLPSGTANAITNTFFALLNGTALLPFDVQKKGVHKLAAWLVEERITFLWISSPLFRNLCETLTGKENFTDLRLLRLMSETAYTTDVEIYKKHFPPNCILLNALHSSETGPLRFYFMNHNTMIGQGEVPVGYPVQDKEILLLDDKGREVGFNEVGEIVVRSRYLSSGYWRRPELTDAKFKPDPEGGDKRLYFTGDLGLLLPDGCLIHKGRKDFRVKIRGYGVEIAEVEKALLAHPAIRETIVVARQNELGESHLAAYCTSSRQPSPSVSEIREFLSKKLPNYMIPAAFLFLDSMPLTPNGKINRRALPDPGNSRPVLETAFVPSRTPVEKELAQIWAEVLSIDKIGIHDSFFDLGGHSLAATRVVSQIIKRFQFEIPLQSLFAAPTVAEMAVVLEEQRGKQIGKAALERMLVELESLSEDEARRLIAEESGTPSRGDIRD